MPILSDLEKELNDLFGSTWHRCVALNAFEDTIKECYWCEAAPTTHAMRNVHGVVYRVPCCIPCCLEKHGKLSDTL